MNTLEIAEYIDTKVKNEAEESLQQIYALGKDFWKKIVPNVPFEEFNSFASGYMAGIRFVAISVDIKGADEKPETESSFEWTKGSGVVENTVDHDK